MKNILNKFLIGAVSIGVMSSCSDFLDQTSPSDLPAEELFNSLDYAHNVLNKAYG